MISQNRFCYSLSLESCFRLVWYPLIVSSILRDHACYREVIHWVSFQPQFDGWFVGLALHLGHPSRTKLLSSDIRDPTILFKSIWILQFCFGIWSVSIHLPEPHKSSFLQRLNLPLQNSQFKTFTYGFWEKNSSTNY